MANPFLACLMRSPKQHLEAGMLPPMATIRGGEKGTMAVEQ